MNEKWVLTGDAAGVGGAPHPASASAAARVTTEYRDTIVLR
jgi:hypothetical protein